MCDRGTDRTFLSAEDGALEAPTAA